MPSQKLKRIPAE